MPIEKNAYPILEYDRALDAVIQPRNDGITLPSTCVMTFFGEVIESFILAHKPDVHQEYRSEMRTFPVYTLEYHGSEICVIQAVVGSASIAMMTEFLIGHGVKNLIVCGGCGVLDDIPAGDVIVPTSALRDEGASYNYLPPARTLDLDPATLDVIRAVLAERGVPFIECMTWSTDAFYRETPDMIAYRREEGCRVVEMECATIAAIARFRGARFGQLLYSGDALFDVKNYDDRGWAGNATARERLFAVSLEVALRLREAREADT